ncbi:MAG: FIST N-terminal domain-containing protein [Gemmataceae bacterium]
MPFAAALSTNAKTLIALEEVCQEIQARIGDPPELAAVFFSPHHAEDINVAVEKIRQGLQPRCLIGCMGESIIGNDKEIEEKPALSLWAGKWNQPVQVDPFHLVLERTPDGFSLMGWPDSLVNADPKHSGLLLLGEPSSFPIDFFLKQVNDSNQGLRVCGGMASGSGGQASCPLVLNERILDHGAVGVVLSGPTIRCIVSQGCRPIGRPMVITKAQENLIYELGGKTPLVQLQELWPELGERDQKLFQQGLHIGRVINEYQAEFQRGDFLVRNVLGLERSSGALGLNDLVRVGQTVQFHVRDAESADEDLHALLQLDLQAHDKPPSGVLAFTCNGRGTRLFPERHHDARVIREETGAIPLAGFFAQGELGPVGGQNFIHGFTASLALFED